MKTVTHNDCHPSRSRCFDRNCKNTLNRTSLDALHSPCKPLASPEIGHTATASSPNAARTTNSVLD